MFGLLPSDWHEIVDVILAIIVGDLCVQGLEAMLVRTWRKRAAMRATPDPPPSLPPEDTPAEPLMRWEVWLRVAPLAAEERSTLPVEKWPSIRYRLDARGARDACEEALVVWKHHHPDRPIDTIQMVRLIDKDQR